MRYYEFMVENTKNNMTILSEIADCILEVFPAVVERGDTRQFALNRSQKFMDVYQKYWGRSGSIFLKDLSDKDIKVYRDALYVLESTQITVCNDPNFTDYYYGNRHSLPESGAGWAYYSDRLNLIMIYAYKFAKNIDGSTGAFTLAADKEYIKSMLVHELRHLFQFAEYGKFMRNVEKSNKFPYEERNYEIDASWNDTLSMANIDQYKLYPNLTPEELAKHFADSVMNHLTKIKKLTPEQVKHYRRKTLTYFSDHYRYRAKSMRRSAAWHKEQERRSKLNAGS